ncbi:uncharacterized protein An01g01760 [Aspergillus niger]|uniref:Contig An01c0070, genomic contig n=2 Tax=Aspergillus niger TaxID=5061 RepID=A2Q7S4_ASPNC|nr:uncharacterized protein An01g01760 [Aspergillus niger]CAK43547.1 unnamed protein product [Aspergillus niger]
MKTLSFFFSISLLGTSLLAAAAPNCRSYITPGS